MGVIKLFKVVIWIFIFTKSNKISDRSVMRANHGWICWLPQSKKSEYVSNQPHCCPINVTNCIVTFPAIILMNFSGQQWVILRLKTNPSYRLLECFNSYTTINFRPPNSLLCDQEINARFQRNPWVYPLSEILLDWIDWYSQISRRK